MNSIKKAMKLLNLNRLAMITALVAGSLSITSAQGQSLVDLGTLAGGNNGEAMGISGNGGVIVGYSSVTGGADHAFKYVGSTMMDLGTLPGGTNSEAMGISGNGGVIVGYSSVTGGADHAIKYVGSTMMDLGTLPGGTNSFAFGVSSDGGVIVGYSDVTGGSNHAFKYVGSTMMDLGTLPGGTYSYANGVSGDGGVIVGYSSVTGGADHAFKYVGSTMTDLGTLAGGTNSYATSASSDGGVIVGYSNIASGAYHAIKYVGSTMMDLGTLAGGTNSYATSVSSDGRVIVGNSDVAGGAYHAIKYVGSTMTDLGTLTGGTNSYAISVSSDGRVIVGSSEYGNGANLHPFAYSVPANVMIDIPNTYTALSNNSYQLNSILNLQNTLVGIGLNHDCNLFGANDVCVAAGGSYTNTTNSTATTTAANVRVAYRFTPKIRAGVFLDQSIANSMPSNYSVKNSQPMAGFFAAWSQLDNNLGPQVKASVAYSNQGATITRTTLANTEAGQGTSAFVGQGAQLEGAWGLGLDDNWMAQPFAGVRAAKVTRNAYSESGNLGFPITYNAVNQNTTTGYAGARLIGQIQPNVILRASAGVEQDLTSNMDNYSGSIYYFGNFSLNTPAVQKTRGFATVGADYLIDKTQHINLSALVNQQQLNNSTAVTGMVTYIAGF